MTLRSVLGLRPKATDSATLRASLSATEAALALVRTVAAELEQQRGAASGGADDTAAGVGHPRLGRAGNHDLTLL